MIVYETSVEDLSAADLDGFFVGWPVPPSPERRLRALRGSTTSFSPATTTRAA